jgi:hypothetical protein
MRQLELSGKRFSMLLVIRLDGVKNKHLYFWCKCDCGKERSIMGTRLTTGVNKSCGCNRTPQTTKKYREHPLYDVWKGMKARCRDKNNISYKNYGAKGVTVCALWERDFLSFYKWCIANGWEQGLQVDKDIIPKQLGVPAILYSPEMCSIITRKENVRLSKRLKINVQYADEIRSSKMKNRGLAVKYGVHISTIQCIKSGKTWVA